MKKRTIFCAVVLISCLLFSCNNIADTTPSDLDGPMPDLSSSDYLPLALDNHWDYHYNYSYRRYNANYQLTQNYDDYTSLILLVVKQPRNQQMDCYWHIDEDFIPIDPPPGLSEITPTLRNSINLFCEDGDVYEHPHNQYDNDFIIGDNMNIGNEAGTSLLLDIGPYTYTTNVGYVTLPAGTFDNVRKLEYHDSYSYDGAEHYYHSTWDYYEYYAEGVGLVWASYHHHDYVSNSYTSDEFTDIELESYVLNE